MTSLSQALKQYGSQAYLITVAPEGPHTSHVQVTLAGTELQFVIGRTARQNAMVNGNVSLLWPPRENGGYSIVVNGVLDVSGAVGEVATLDITKSVFHRPGPATRPGGSCSSDCQQLTLDASRAG